MVKTRGYTLIELMITVATIGLAATALLHNLQPYQDAAQRSFHHEGVARVLDAEMERMRACDDRRCLRSLDTKTSTVVTTVGASWLRASVRRTVTNGPDGTMRVRIEATPPGRAPTQHLEALMWVPR